MQIGEAGLKFSALAMAATAFVTVPASAADWTTGKAREVDQGYYFTLLSSEDGWRLWQIETKDGIRCVATKAAAGRTAPSPMGVADHFSGGTPFLVVSKGHKGFGPLGRIGRFTLQGRHGNGQTVQFRGAGEKFWTKWKVDQDISGLDGARLEVNVVSFRYPHSLVGSADETGIIDLTGLAAAIGKVEACGTLDY